MSDTTPMENKKPFSTEEWAEGVHNSLTMTHAERLRQLKKWGPQHHDLPTWIAILTEEVGELSAEVLKARFEGVVTEDAIIAEAIQVAAVALAIVQDVKNGSS